nr:reverse transcriptase domain-containing protein [Tanacetum cinerariifolium]
YFPTDFVVVDYVVDPRVPLILERPFLRIGRTLIDVYSEELTLRVADEAITFKVQTPGSGISILLAVGTPSTGSGNLYCQWELSPGSGNALCILFPTGQTLKYSYNNSESINQIDVIDVACEEYVQEVLGFFNTSKSGSPTPASNPIISFSSTSFTPFERSDFILEEIETFLQTPN